MIQQNELKISQQLIIDLIENRNFNKKSLGGNYLNDTTLFNSFIDSLYFFEQNKSMNFSDQPSNKIYWWTVDL